LPSDIYFEDNDNVKTQFYLFSGNTEFEKSKVFSMSVFQQCNGDGQSNNRRM